jgi:hypothetical protein
MDPVGITPMGLGSEMVMGGDPQQILMDLGNLGLPPGVGERLMQNPMIDAEILSAIRDAYSGAVENLAESGSGRFRRLGSSDIREIIREEKNRLLNRASKRSKR